MSWVTLLAIVVITAGSRVLALALLPPPRGALAGLAQRLPAPLFAALAALSLTGSAGGVTSPPMLVAVGCALLVSRWSSLLLTLGAGVAGFLVAGLLW